MREPVIKSMTEKVIAHAAANGGSCRQGFVKDLVDGSLWKDECNEYKNVTHS
jgi:hypothetical protein